MYNPEFILGNEMQKIPEDLEIQMYPLISTRRPDMGSVYKKKKEKKRTCQLVDFAVTTNHIVKTGKKG